MSKAYFNTHGTSTNVRIKQLRQALFHGTLSLAGRWMPDLTRRLVLQLLAGPTSYKASAAERVFLDTGQAFHVMVNGKRIKAWRWGAGPAVLMIHGWNGRGVQFQGFVAPLVAAGYTAIAVDGPAHGQSDGRITSYFEFTDTLRTFLDPGQSLNIKGAIGHSFGAGALINALAKDRHTLHAVFIAPVLQLRELFCATVREFGIPAAMSDQFIADFEKQFGYSLTEDNPHRLLDQVYSQILIVHDTDDRTVSLSESKKHAAPHGHMALHVTQGLGHRRILSDVDVIRASINHIVAGGSGA